MNCNLTNRADKSRTNEFPVMSAQVPDAGAPRGIDVGEGEVEAALGNRVINAVIK